MWNLPQSEIELVSPALAGEFFTTESPGKPLNRNFESIIPLTDHSGAMDA